MKEAIIELNSKQYKVSPKQILKIDALDEKAVPKVLFFSDGDIREVGTPYLEKYSVTFTILENKKDKKIMVKRFKAKSRYKKTKGHRQPVSIIKIEDIVKV